MTGRPAKMDSGKLDLRFQMERVEVPDELLSARVWHLLALNERPKREDGKD